MRKVRVNIRTAVNTATIRRERRDGRDVIIVPSATLPDGVVMNGIRYEASEIEKSFASLDRTPAPLGHPTINGRFVSASDPEGLARGWIGAWNENVRRENGRVMLDKVIDVTTAGQLEGGKAVLAAIEKGEPIHTSTGLLCNLDACSADQPDGAKHIARNMVFDHDAILIGEEGAATPEQGVGMLVNGQQVDVINSDLTERAERELDWTVEQVARAMEAQAKLPMLKRIKDTLLSLLGAGEGQPAEDETETKEQTMTVSKEQFDALSATVNTLAETVKGLGSQITNAVAAAVKPLTDAQAEMQANAKAQAEAEKAELVNKVVKANILPEEVAKTLTNEALRALAPKAEPGTAAALNAGGFGTGNDEWAGYSLNALIEEKK